MSVGAWDRRDSLAVGALTLACLLLFAWGLGSYPLWDPWESMHAEALLEMTERGDRITPWLDGKANPTQPILIYWAMAVPAAIGGNTAFTARLPSALAALAGVLLVFYCLRRLRGFNTALVAAAVLATLPQYFYMARQAMPDMLFTALLTGALGLFALAHFQQDRRRAHALLAYACLALAGLAKGPLALVLFGGTLFLFALFQVQRESLARPATWWSGLRGLTARYHVGPGVVVFLAIAAPWHLLLAARGGSGFADGFLWTESLRYFREAVGGASGTSEFYALDLFHGMYPWIALLPLSLLYLFHETDRFDEDARQKWFFVAWALTVFALFTLAATKLDHYLLPLAPAVAVLVALAFEAWFRERAPFWVATGFLVSIPLALLPVRDFLIEGDRYLFRVFASSQSLDHPGLAFALKLFLAAWVAAMLLLAFRRRSWVAVGLAVAVAFGHAVYMTQSVLPQSSGPRTLRGYTELIERAREPDADIVFYGRPAYSMHYYFGRERFRRFPAGKAGELAAGIEGKPHVYIVAESDELSDLASALRQHGNARWLTLADDHPDYVLLTNSRAFLQGR